MGKSGTPIKVNPRRSRGNTECMEEVRPAALLAVLAVLGLRRRPCNHSNRLGPTLLPPRQMNSFFTCMAKFTDVEDKCTAEMRALTNCATAAVSARAGGATSDPAAAHLLA